MTLEPSSAGTGKMLNIARFAAISGKRTRKFLKSIMPSSAMNPTVPTGPVIEVSGILPVISPPKDASIRKDNFIV